VLGMQQFIIVGLMFFLETGSYLSINQRIFVNWRTGAIEKCSSSAQMNEIITSINFCQLRTPERRRQQIKFDLFLSSCAGWPGVEGN
jgi:hypothetical protein